MTGLSGKGALELLSSYGGDSSDDEVPGTRCSTKRMHKDDNDEESNNSKRFQINRLPLPAFFTKQDSIEMLDDDSLHQGRKRSFPHERGNWATYIYIPFELNEGLEKLLFTIMENSPIQLEACTDLHLSLTKTVILKHHWIDLFINSVKEKLQQFVKFIVMFGSLEVYCNEEKTRTFIGIKVKTGTDTLLGLVNAFDDSLKEFNLETFYANPSFHISILWCIGDCNETLKSMLHQMNQRFDNIMKEFPQECWYKFVEQISCKTGNKVFLFSLA